MFHDLHASDIRGVVAEIDSYQEKDFPFFLFLWASHLLAFLWPFFLISHVIVPTINNIFDCLFHHQSYIRLFIPPSCGMFPNSSVV
jgi:hypothetical protein